MTENIKFDVIRADGKRYYGDGQLFTESVKNELVKDYFDWKRINERQKAYQARRLNFPESISEGLSCYCLGLLRTNKTVIHGAISSSCDAINPNTGLTYQIKACSTIEKNPTSGSPSTFGPRSEADELFYLHMDCNEDKMYFYRVSENIENIMVNKSQTFKDQCDEGRRPRFDLLPRVKGKIPYVGYFDYKTGEYVKCLD